MRKSYLRKNKFLRRLNRGMKRRLGENIYMIIGIMAILLVFSGLVVGLLGRGWLGAWFLVLLGLILGFFPALSFIMTQNVVSSVKAEKEEAKLRREERKRQSSEEQKRQAVEFEAMLARARLKKEEQHKKEMEEVRERILADYQMRMAAKELKAKEEKRLEQERRNNEEKERMQRRKLEEERQRQKIFQSYMENGGSEGTRFRSTGGNVYKKETVGMAKKGYFEGVTDSESLKRRYRELMKKYHPDNGQGEDNTEIIMVIQQEYKEFERFFKSYEKHKR